MSETIDRMKPSDEGDAEGLRLGREQGEALDPMLSQARNRGDFTL